jgi:hypothetical protein
MLTKSVRVKVGNVLKCLYPKNGNRNILTAQEGRIEKVGQNWVTIQRTDGSYRTLSGLKIVSPVVSN